MIYLNAILLWLAFSLEVALRVGPVLAHSADAEGFDE